LAEARFELSLILFKARRRNGHQAQIQDAIGRHHYGAEKLQVQGNNRNQNKTALS
jgi:hypothetical protein